MTGALNHCATTAARRGNVKMLLFITSKFAAVTFLTGLSASSRVHDTVRLLLVAITLGDIVAPALANILVVSKQTHSLYIH